MGSKLLWELWAWICCVQEEIGEELSVFHESGERDTCGGTVCGLRMRVWWHIICFLCSVLMSLCLCAVFSQEKLSSCKMDGNSTDHFGGKRTFSHCGPSCAEALACRLWRCEGALQGCGRALCPSPALLTQAVAQGGQLGHGKGAQLSPDHILNPIPPAQLVHPVAAQLLLPSPPRLACRTGLALLCHRDLTPCANTALA